MTITVNIIPNDKNLPAGKLADAELRFAGGPMDGLKLCGFAIWQRRSGTGLNVTFPARTYSVNGERRSFSLLRPAGADLNAQDGVRDLILLAWAEFEAQGDTGTPQITEAAARATTASRSANRLDSL